MLNLELFDLPEKKVIVRRERSKNVQDKRPKQSLEYLCLSKTKEQLKTTLEALGTLKITFPEIFKRPDSIDPVTILSIYCQSALNHKE